MTLMVPCNARPATAVRFFLPRLRNACSIIGKLGRQPPRLHARHWFPAQIENRICLGLTLATLPGVKVQPFYLAGMDVPNPIDPPAVWTRAVRIRDEDNPEIDVGEAAGPGGEAGMGEPIFMAYATTQSIDAFGDYMAGMDAAFPQSQKIGAIASTVSR